MKKRLFAIILSVVMLCAFSQIIASAEETPMPEGTVITVSASADERELYAASVIQQYIGELDGTAPVIVKDSESSEAFEIAVGNTNRFTADLEGLSDGGYVIKSFDGGIAVCGVGMRGTIYGAYAFLEEFGGYHCFTSALGMTTDKTEFSVSENIDIRKDVFFEYTDTDWRSPCDVTYSLANGLNGGPYRTIEKEMGGTVDYISSFCHTLTTQFCPADTYFNDHPEYFALRDGVRVPDQLCLTNEEVYNIVLDEVLALIEERHDPEAAVQIVSLTQNDNYKYCTCDACAAVDEENGSQSGTMITFVNRIAAAVKEAGYDNIAIDTFAYQYTRKAPSVVKPLDNVIVRLCTIECCFSHPINDETCEENADLCKDLENWNAICNRIYVWDYTTNYAYTVGIFPDFGVIQQNIQFFYEHGVKGVYEEGNYYINSCDGEFGEFRSYLLSRFMQDPYVDFDEEADSFLEAYYGAGWKNIRDFIDITITEGAKKHVRIYDSMTESLSLTKQQISDIDALWQQAKDECTDDEQLSHILRSELCWRYWKAAEHSLSPSMLKQRAELLKDLQQMGFSMLREGQKSFSLGSFKALMSSDLWSDDTDEIAADMCVTVAEVLFGFALICALVVLIRGIKQKKYIYIVPFPLLLALLEVVMWNRRAYIAWKDLAGYALSTIIIAAVFSFLFIAYRMAGKAFKAKDVVLWGVIGAVAFIIPYELILLIVNVLIFKYQSNQLAIAIACIVMALSCLVVEALTAKRLARGKKEEISQQEEIL